MGLTDNYTGIGMSPRPAKKHQIAMRNILIALHDNSYGDETLTEFCVDSNDLDTPAPDIIIYNDINDRYPVIIIEITKTKERNIIKEKAIKLMKDYPAIREAFIYDYKNDQWQKISKEADPDPEQSYSDILGIDFSLYLCS